MFVCVCVCVREEEQNVVVERQKKRGESNQKVVVHSIVAFQSQSTFQAVV